MIGSGGMASRHLRALAGEPQVEIGAIASPTPGHAEALAAQWGGRPYTDLDTLLDKEPVEAAWICVPPAAHGPIEQELIRRNIPFFVEKPLAVDLPTAEEIGASIAAHRGCIAGVGYHWRAMDTIDRVHPAVASNAPRLVLGTWLGPMPNAAWWRRRATSGGQFVEQATHLFDLARLLVGEARVVESLHAAGPAHAFEAGPGDTLELDAPGAGAALLTFERGAIGVFSATSLLAAPSEVSLRLVGEGLEITIRREGVIYEDRAGRREDRTGNDPILAEDRAFLAAVHAQDPGLLFSDYADALRTHRLCVEAAGGRTLRPSGGSC